MKIVLIGAAGGAFAAFLRPQCAINEMLTAAYRTRDRKPLLQALLLDPCVDSVENARRLLDDMLTLQSEFLPEF